MKKEVPCLVGKKTQIKKKKDLSQEEKNHPSPIVNNRRHTILAKEKKDPSQVKKIILAKLRKDSSQVEKKVIAKLKKRSFQSWKKDLSQIRKKIQAKWKKILIRYLSKKHERVCRPEYVSDEKLLIENIIKTLHYPNPLIYNRKKKSIQKITGDMFPNITSDNII